MSGINPILWSLIVFLAWATFWGYGRLSFIVSRRRNRRREMIRDLQRTGPIMLAPNIATRFRKETNR